MICHPKGVTESKILPRILHKEDPFLTQNSSKPPAAAGCYTFTRPFPQGVSHCNCTIGEPIIYVIAGSPYPL